MCIAIVARCWQPLESQQEELSIWRDLGLRNQEITALQDLATIYDHLGKSLDSQRALEEARRSVMR